MSLNLPESLWLSISILSSHYLIPPPLMAFCPLSNQQVIYSTHTISVSHNLTVSLFSFISHFTIWFLWRMTPPKTSQHDGVTSSSSRLEKFQRDPSLLSFIPIVPRWIISGTGMQSGLSPQNRPEDIRQTAVEGDSGLWCPAQIRDLVPETHGCL